MTQPLETKTRLFKAKGSGLTMSKATPMTVPASAGGARFATVPASAGGARFATVPASAGGARFATTPGAPGILSAMRESIEQHEVKEERRKGARIIRRRKGTRRRVRRTSRTRRRGR